MRVLFCIKAMGNSGGGAERVLAAVINGLAYARFEVHLVTFENEKKTPFYNVDKRIKQHFLATGSTINKAGCRETLARIIKLRKFVSELKPDIIVGFMHSMYIPLGIAMLGKNIPIIASEHIVPEHYKSRPFEAALLNLTPYLVDKITCVSEQVFKSYPKRLQEKMVVIPNPITLPDSKADVIGKDGHRKVCLAIGRLEPQKAHHVLIDAFAKVAHRCEEWDLHIVGSGSLREKLVSRVSSYNLESRVIFIDKIKDIGRKYESSQLFVQPSQYESFGLTTAEAIAYKLPCVGFDDCIGTNELIIHNVNGLLVNAAVDRAFSLAENLERLMLDESLRLKLSSQETNISKKYEIDNVLSQWRKLFESLTEARIIDDKGNK